jgi:hypothetical protein
MMTQPLNDQNMNAANAVNFACVPTDKEIVQSARIALGILLGAAIQAGVGESWADELVNEISTALKIAESRGGD